MYGRGMPRNPYGGAPPFSPRDQGFKSPRPLFHSSPMPRFNQQAVPHYTSPPHNHMHPSRSPNSQHFSPSPGRSYNNSFNSSNHSHSYNRSFSSNNRSQFTSPTSFRGNSSFNRNKNGSHYQNFSRNYADSNPGGSGDPNDYYHPSMTRDPWQNLRPVSVTNKGPTTT